MRVAIILRAVLALAVTLAAGPAHAAIISGTWTFAADGFGNGFGPFSGSFTFAFDNRADILDSTALTVNSLSPNPFGTVAYAYQQATDSLFIYDLLNGAFVGAGTTDFFVVFDGASTASPAAVGIAVANGGLLSVSGVDPGITLTGGFTPGAAAVPEPSGLALLGLGLLGLGLARFGRARTGAALCLPATG